MQHGHIKVPLEVNQNEVTQAKMKTNGLQVEIGFFPSLQSLRLTALKKRMIRSLGEIDS